MRGGSSKKDDAWIARNAEERFLRAIRPGDVPERYPELGPCLIFRGAMQNGYGQFRYNRRQSYAHRYAWERENGPIPDGMTVDHLCYVRNCVNVAHMEIVDGVTNYLRGVEQRIQCPNGHSYPEGRQIGDNCPECYQGHVVKQRNRYRAKRSGLPDTRVRYDQGKVKEVIDRIVSGELTITQGARDIGCNPNYLGRRTWDHVKKIVIVRDDSRCVRCGEESVDVHHRKPRGQGGSYDPKTAFGLANLISLCRSCHAWIHGHPADSYELGYLVRSWQDPENISIGLCDRTFDF